MTEIVVLGSTGSIGRATLDIVDRYPERFRVVGLVAGRNAPLLAEQVRRFRPRAVAVAEPAVADRLATLLGEDARGVTIGAGEEAICSVATLPEAERVVAAIVGGAGLAPTVAAIQAGKWVALANKEVLVMAGEWVMAEVARCDATLLPVDSEHSAIFQALTGRTPDQVERLILTASGGPFRTWPREQLEGVTPEQALRHPRWKMGSKITVDSATLMNKGLEVIEARWLFGCPPERIRVLIHPQSVIHSMVELVDGSVIAQLAAPDMRGPIAYALTYPERLDLIRQGGAPRLEFNQTGALEFADPDMELFPALALAYRALETGGTAPAVLSVANEIAVEAFLVGRISFPRIAALVADVLARHRPVALDSLTTVTEAGRWARAEANRLLGAEAS